MSLRAVVFRPGATQHEVVRLVRTDGTCRKALRALVGGNLALLPHKKDFASPWVAYANANGAQLGLPVNSVAWGTLRYLGFRGRNTPVPGAHLGTIVLCKTEAGENVTMKAADLNMVDAAYEAYEKELEETRRAGEKRAPPTPVPDGEPAPKKGRMTGDLVVGALPADYDYRE